jgi:hypothetical protein
MNPLMRGTCRNLRSRLEFCAVALAASLPAAWSQAQQPAPTTAAQSAAPQFGPGVVTTIAPEVDAADTVSIHDIVELRADKTLEWTPSKWLEWDSATPAPTNRTLYEISKDAAFLQDVWCLEFAFKPLRMIEVDIPQESGRAVRKQIWYMVYRVRNTGAGLQGEAAPDGSYATTAKSTDNLHFIPQFILSSHERPNAPGAVRKAYLDRVIPAAMAAIQRREMPSGTLHNSVDISEQNLPIEAGRAERGVWGVAMWEDVDPELDFFSLYVSGLTNAYRWVDAEGGFQPGDRVGKGRTFARKMLQLNFWRPGDALDPSEREIRYGVAPGESELYGSGEGVAYQWRYR